MEQNTKPDKKIRKLTLIINQQKAELLRLNESEKLLNTVLDVVAGIHWWKDQDGVYRGCNEAMVTELGLKTKDDIIGKTDHQLPWSEHADALLQNDQEVMRTGQIQKGKEELIKTNNGQIHTFMVAKAPLYDETGQVIGTVGNSINITEQKILEQELRTAKKEAEKATRLKSDFIENMQHDIRTPFSGVYGLAHILWRKEKNTEKKTMLSHIVSTAKELLDYCNTILDFSKSQAGNFPVVHKNFDVHELIQKVTSMELAAANAKNIQLSSSIKNCPRFVIGDEYRLTRILLNLLSNAVKFTAEGYVKLNVSGYQKKDRNIILKFVIEDSGIGIPENKQELIGEAFVRCLPSNKGIYKGLGLGIPIVKRFIHELKGELEVKSEINKGSIFTCILPFKLSLLAEE